MNERADPAVTEIDGFSLPRPSWLQPEKGGYLTPEHVANAYWAVAYSNHMTRRTMSVHVDVAWGLAGVKADYFVKKATQILLERYRHWCKLRGEPCHHLWVIERGKRLGLHTHLLIGLHYTYHQAFENWIFSAVKGITGVPPITNGTEKTIRTDYGDGYDFDRQWRRLAYMIKGASPDFVYRDRAKSPHHLSQILAQKKRYLRHPGAYSYKRLGVSHEIGFDQRGRNFLSTSTALPIPRLIFSDRPIADWRPDDLMYPFTPRKSIMPEIDKDTQEQIDQVAEAELMADTLRAMQLDP